MSCDSSECCLHYVFIYLRIYFAVYEEGKRKMEQGKKMNYNKILCEILIHQVAPRSKKMQLSREPPKLCTNKSEMESALNLHENSPEKKKMKQ